MIFEVCIYDVKEDKLTDFEELMNDILVCFKYHEEVLLIDWCKRTHKRYRFISKKNKEPIERINRENINTYIFYISTINEETYLNVTTEIANKYHKRFIRCLESEPINMIGSR